VVAGSARIGGIDVEIAAFDFSFFGGSMGEVTGERLAAAMERAMSREVPFLLRTATGGARMQEGMRSLVQMPKVVSARIALGDAGQPFIAVLGHPTTGGVLASVAALADVTVAEAGATIGFAGPRVAERFTGTPLPDGSHSANSAYAAGLIDELVSSGDAHSYVAGVLKVLGPDGPAPVDPPPSEDSADIDPWDLVQLVRSPGHPKGPDLVRAAADSFVELRGDRSGAEDPAVFAALARVAGRKVLAIALDRDHHPGPHGFRKARRCLDIATRLRIPVITLVDTRGADPSAPSEAGGIAWEIARLFEAMLRAPVPILSFVTGEGGSGGALAFATSDKLIAFDRSIFSVIGPEGAAEILWRDGARASEAAAALRLTATDLLNLGIADEVVPGTATPEAIRYAIAAQLNDVTGDGAARRRRWRSV
jgi:acetyl-CoA carboxylase carboxyl transferase subunit beta